MRWRQVTVGSEYSNSKHETLLHWKYTNTAHLVCAKVDMPGVEYHVVICVADAIAEHLGSSEACTV